MPDGYRYDPKTGQYIAEIEEKLCYVDANTGEWLDFAGNGAPTTDEEAELVLPRPPKYSKMALDTYYKFRQQGLTIMEAIVNTFKTLDEAGEL